MSLKDKIAKAKQEIYVEKEQKWSKILLAVLLWTWLISGTHETLTSTRNLEIRNSVGEVAQAATLSEGEPTDIATDLSVVEVKEETQVASVQGIEQMIRQAFGNEAEIALAVARCESQLNPNAIGDQKIAYKLDGKDYGTSHGIFQIRHLPGRPEPSQLHNAKFNIEYAKTIKDKQGWEAWYWCANHNGIIL